MDSQTVDNNDGIIVEFIKDEAVVCVIKDEILHKNNSKISIGRTPKLPKDNPRKYRSPAKNKKTKQTLDDNREIEEYSENKSDVILKPKALFVDGDVPGERMFSFNSKQRKTSASHSPLKTPISKTKKANVIPQRGKSHNDDQEMCNTHPQILFDDESDTGLRTSHNKSTRASSKSSATLKTKNGFTDNDSQILIDSHSSYETPKKAKKHHMMNSSKIQNSAEHLLNSATKIPSSENYSNDQILTKTPRVVRKQIAKGIADQKFEQLNELNDSDYSISDKSDETDSDSSAHSDVNTEQPEVKNSNTSLRRSTRKKDVSFMYKPEEYFLSKSAKSLKKSKTSDNTLKLLKNPVLDKIQVDKLSENPNTSHDKKLKALYKEIVSNFPYWLCLLKEGFNLLLYGLGSKRQIINDFRISMLEKESVLVINGFFPGLTLKEVLESITIDLLDLESCPGSAELAVQQIEETQKSKNAEHIYILIHNLDGVELQNYKTQHVLSRICSLKNVHFIASIDRVNSALMWDNTKLSDYNFIWMDCTNYLPYTVETSYVESLMVKNTGSIHAFSALNNVYKSLNSNSKHILLLLIKNCIENKNDKKYAGVPFSTLYDWCREQFLVSTDLALRSQLTEFVDHQLVKWKRDSDVLYVPVDIDVLIQFYKQNEEGCE